MTEADFLFAQQFILQKTGIVISNEKRYLIETRLEPVARQMGLASLVALIAKLRLREPLAERLSIDALTTNETLFFRDKQPFDVIRETILPQLAAARRGAGLIRIWSAACSTGQEAYSIAMMLEDMRPQLGGIKVEILATDISEKVVEQAKAGVFSQFEVQRGLPVKQLLQHFRQEGTRWRIDPALGRCITFRTGNLLNPFSTLGRFDLILCRNVMIYFAEATKKDILRKLAEVLAPDGSLMLGGAETVLGLSDTLAPHKGHRGVYVHAASPEAYRVGERFRQAG
jgi:chemotaxis protein methyltransferase CheR